MAVTIKDVLPPSCDVQIPTEGEPTHAYLGDRWMNTAGSTLPAAVVAPSNEEELLAVVRHARDSGMKIVLKGGGHAAFVVIDRMTIYLDMRKFTKITYDLKLKTATIGGGVRWKQVMSTLIPEGYYTSWTHFSNLGVVGSLLGGGLSDFIGMHGYSCDEILSVRLVTSSGSVTTLARDKSTGEEEELLDLIRGAGIGFGIITSVTLRLRDIASLQLDGGDKIFKYVAMFPEPAFDLVADVMAGQLPVKDSRLSLSYALAHVPPGMPGEGLPVAMIAGNFVGSRAAAEAALSGLLAKEVAEKALFAQLSPVSLAQSNAQADARFSTTPPGHNDVFNALVQNVSSRSIREVTKRWLAWRHTEPQLANKLTLILGCFSTQGSVAADPKRSTGFPYRDRGFVAQCLLISLHPGEVAGAQLFCDEVVSIWRRDDDALGLPHGVFPNNSRVRTSFAEVCGRHNVERYQRAKAFWDPNGVFWGRHNI